MKVFLIKGGFSTEREISLRTGAFIEDILSKLKYPFWSFDLTQDNFFDMIDKIRHATPDVVFNALHGKFGEDGRIQAVLDCLKIPYSHSPVFASALGMDKVKSRILFKNAGLTVPEYRCLTWTQLRKKEPFPKPYVVKPVGEGSSLGVSLIRTDDNLQKAQDAWDYGDVVLVEPYIEGQEIHVGILGDKILGTVLVQSPTGMVDYDAKYVPGKSERISPAPISEVDIKIIQDYAYEAHKILGCYGLTRVEFIHSYGKFYILEINTQPGLTPTSFVPMIAKNCLGWSDERLIDNILKDAMKRRELKRSEKFSA